MDTVCSESLMMFCTSISHGVENRFPGLWSMVISNASFFLVTVFSVKFAGTLSKESHDSVKSNSNLMC